MTIEPSAVASAVENLRVAVEREVAGAEAECQRATDRLNKVRGEIAKAEAAHERGLAEKTAQQEREHAKRMKEIAARELNLANGQRELAAERERVSARERFAEERASYLTSRLQGTAA